MIARREFLIAAATGVAALSAANDIVSPAVARAVSTPPWIAKVYRPEQFGRWPSDVDQHLALYEGYVKKANELLELIASADRAPAAQSTTYSMLREAKVEYSFAVGGIKNHEVFFDHLLPAAKSSNHPPDSVITALNAHFGSFEKWREDLIATAISARGWVWLAFDLERKTLFNYIGDSQNAYPIWSSVPVLAVDMFEHAFFKDYGKNRSAYLTDLLARINWEVVAQNLSRAERLAKASDGGGN